MSSGNLDPAAAKGTLLVVDDNAENLEVIGEMLKEAGYRVIVARNGERAVERAERNRPDMILLDVKMPGEDGFALCGRFKTWEETAAIPVVFMTALSDEASKVRGFEVGGVDYVTKPVSRGELLARVANHLEIARYRKTLEAEVARRVGETERLAEERGILLEHMDAHVWYLTDENTYGIANRAHADFLGVSPEELVGAKLEAFLPAPAAEVCRSSNREAFLSDGTFWSQEWSTNSAGEKRLLSIAKTPRRLPNGEVDQLVCVAVDLTEEYRLRKELEEQLETNRSLLLEVHHRVKNNLSIILSLINLQMGAVQTDEDAIEALKATANRIFSMSAIHESLYQTGLTQEVSIRPFVDALVRRLSNSCETREPPSVDVDVEDARIPLETGIPLGMILNELLFIAHSETPCAGTTGSIRIQVNWGSPEELVVHLRQDGAPTGSGVFSNSGFEHDLLTALCEQLNASIEFGATGGGRFAQVTVPVTPADPS